MSLRLYTDLFIGSLVLLLVTSAEDWHFTSDFYTGTIPECEFRCEKLYLVSSERMGIEIVNSSSLQSIKYRISNKESDEFKAEELIVGNFAFLFIRTKTDGSAYLNREKQASYSLQIRARVALNDGQVINAFTHVSIRILDVNDATPLFANPRYTINVSDTTAVFSSIGQVKATDADEGINAEIYYSLETFMPEFTVHPTSGILYLSKKLTSSTKSKFSNTVVAGNRVKGKQSKVPIEFNIQQRNQHKPEFIITSRPSLSAYTPPGMTVLILKVRDADSGLNGEIQTVSIISALSPHKSDARLYFRILPTGDVARNEYKLEVARDISDIGNHVNITIQAWDKGDPEQSSSVIIAIDIITYISTDKADKPISLEINEGLPPGTPIYYISPPADAIDASYHIEKDPLDAFKVHSTSGVLFLKNPVDAEKTYQTSIQVRLRAKLGPMEKMDLIRKFDITVNDDNDNAPVFHAHRPVELPEDAEIGTVVMIASASDADAGDNSKIVYSIINDDNLPFKINPFTGEIQLTKQLDYERGKRLYHITVRASDMGSPFSRQTDEIYTIPIRNVNDNKPMFEQEKCSGFISKDQPVGTQIRNISAVDLDQGDTRITYSLSIEDTFPAILSMNPNTGTIFTALPLDQLEGKTIKAKITATDGQNFADPIELVLKVTNPSKPVSQGFSMACSETSAKRLLVEANKIASAVNPSSESLILPANNSTTNKYTPQFDSKFKLATQYSLPEDLQLGSIVTHITATDMDSGYEGLIRYTIPDGNTWGHFAINLTTGALIVFAPLDREKTEQYNLTIMASDMSELSPRSSTIQFILSILDSNDNTPKFLSDSYEAYISEGDVRGTKVIQVMATDADMGSNGQVEYTMVTDTPYFAIDSMTGVIIVRSVLDRETKDKHILEIKATDRPAEAGQARTATTTVKILVTDINDNPPVFMKQEYRVKVREDMPVGSVITSLVAQDADLPATGGGVSYKITKGEETIFSIDPDTGLVRLMQKLDYEKWNLYSLTIRAKDNGTEALKSTCKLLIEVVDVNENYYTPQFQELVYSGKIKENQFAGSKVLQVEAVDLDEGPSDKRLTYTITKGSGLGRFTVDDYGWVKTSMVLDRETDSHYWVTVTAQDHGTIPLSSSVEVYIEVEDLNDNAPQAEFPVYYVSVRENSPPNVEILAITATDKDQSSAISYDITGGNTQSLFSIDGKTGVVKTTKRKLDRESDETHILEVTLSDKGNPELTSTTRVWVTVLDENDNEPMFEASSKGFIPLLKFHDRNKPVYRVLASDKDKGLNARISYSLAEPQSATWWRIDSVTGNIYLKDDWPSFNEVLIQVKASDGGDKPLSNMLPVEFSLVDGLDVRSLEPPVFSASLDLIPIWENAHIFEVVDIVQATDPDSTRLWYSIEGGADYQSFPMFVIQSTTGLIQVAGHLDYEAKPEYNLNISVTDGTHTAYKSLKVVLSDVNEHKPSFEKRVFEATVNEKTRIGEPILAVTAVDEDKNDRLEYLILSATCNKSFAMFAINHQTGVISSTAALDHETTRVHELVVKVVNYGVKTFSDFVKVIITIEDDNDHAPKFVTDMLSVRAHEMTAIGSTITQVQATDSDKGENSRIEYSIQSGNIGYTFGINSELGIITLARPFDLGVRSEYEIIVMANDKGKPPLSSTCVVKVKVTVADEQPPDFESSTFTAELKENEPIGSFVTALSGRSQSALTYTIVQEDSGFAVNPYSGIVTSTKVFDHEEQFMYNITVLATDIIGHQVELLGIIHIIDKNDNRPMFLKTVYYGHVSEGSQDGSIILADDAVPLILTAKDLDSNLNALLLYSILDVDVRRYFSIDPNTGALRTVKTPDREMKSQYEFTVQVYDQGEESLSAANPAKVVVVVDDVNDTPPVFPSTHYETTLLVPTYKGVVVHSATAYDPDLNTQLQYQIASGNTLNRFSVDTKTGKVYVSDPKSLLPIYSLLVKVSDGVFESSYNLTIRVTETAQTGLLFSESDYQGRVIENSTNPQAILVIQPYGLERSEPVTFEVLNFADLFDIGFTSGVLKLRKGVALDRETNSSYLVIVRVQTHGSRPKTSQVPVNISVVDVNDNAPYFTKEPYYAIINLNAEKGSHVFKVVAVDSDEGNNRQIKYDLIEQGEDCFRINKKTGEIFLKRTLSADQANKEMTFSVIAQDMGEPSLSSQTQITVKVVTESTPIFAQVFYEETIPENIPIGSAVLTVTSESPKDNKIIYTILEGDANNEFTVHYSTGTVRVNDDLDFETKMEYHLKIRAVDVITGDWSDTNVLVHIQDVNDELPKFERSYYYASVSEAVTTGSEILTIRAIDLDQGINSRVYYSLQPTNNQTNINQLFDVKTTSDGFGKIVTKGPLDFESKSRHEFVIIATDGGSPRLSSEAYVQISLNDLNDNAPLFEDSAYYVDITDEMKRGQFVAMVAAVDPDKSNEDDLMYNIVHGNDGQAFSINQRSGAVYVAPFHQPLAFKDIYILNVSVSDGTFTSFTSLAITVRPANRHNPVFESLLYNFKVLENVTEVLGQVIATDEDSGKYGLITYSIIGDSLKRHFKINPQSGDIALLHPLDREERDFYTILVMAQDSGGRTAFATVYVIVVDINDNRPEFIASIYTTALNVNSTKDYRVLVVSAYDLDKDRNGMLTYSIVSESAYIKSVVDINPQTGKILLKRNLTKQDADKELSFFVRASDSGDEVMDTLAPVTLMFTQDPVPSFTSDETQVFLKEVSNIGSEVTKVQAVYSGPHAISYRIRHGSSMHTNHPESFVIDSHGKITTATALDAEAISSYKLLVECYTLSDPELIATHIVFVTPIGLNDNPPTFTSDVYHVKVTEDVPIGSNIVQILATDSDRGHDTTVVYSFAPESSTYSNLFLIDPHHGWISTLVPLDREQQPVYEFHVLASDEDGQRKLNSTAKVKIDLIDVNDNPPRFTNTTQIAAVNEGAPNGTIVVILHTEDADLPEHSTKMYYISDGNNRGHFRIKQSGEIFVSKALDREETPEYNLQVTATDGVFVTEIMVKILILDDNDNAPVCAQPFYTKIIREDVDVGMQLLRIVASDADEPNTPNSKIQYSLRGVSQEDFAIDRTRGDLRVNRKLDRERLSSYRLTGIASDSFGFSCTTDILIEVTDVNDNTPVFDQLKYTHTLPEDSVNNTLITRVTATDKDLGLARKVTYSIHSGASGTVTVDTLTGIVRLIRPVKREEMERFSVVIAATDKGTPPRTSTVELVVYISDVNDPPVFEKSLYNKTFAEDIKPGTELLRVKARSTDTGLNNIITYRISDSGSNDKLFSIDKDTGVLTTSGTFDYEIVREYVLTIEARDAGTPPMSDTCIVTLHVTDVNDNKPMFSQATYSASVREDAKISDSVLMVQAHDADSGSNADLTYHITSGDDLAQFHMDSNSGYLTVAAALDREALSEYRLLVTCWDNGSPIRQYSLVTIYLTVTDVNDNAPQFSQANYTAHVQVYPDGAVLRNTTFLMVASKKDANGSDPQAGKGFSYSPLTLRVSDADLEPNNGPFRYEILSGDSGRMFHVTESGQVLAVGEFDINKQREYLLKIRVDDNGIPPLSATTYVKVTVQEATLHPPEVISPRNFTVLTYEDMFPGGVFGHVMAVDPDFDTLVFGLESPRLQAMFNVDAASGAIKSYYKLDSGTYILNVSATDGRFIRYGIIEVKVISVTNEMIEDAVAVRIEQITPNEFISSYKRAFERALVTLSTDIRQVYVLGLSESSDVSRGKRQVNKRGVTALVAAERLSGEIMRKQQLALLIRDKRSTIKSILGGLDINLPMEGLTCSAAKKCRLDEKCELGFNVTQEKAAVHSEMQSFVSLVTVPQEVCRCQGPLCIDPCLSNPCPETKECIRGDLPHSYTCLCPADTFGPDCSIHSGSPLAFNANSYARWTLVKDIKRGLNLRLSFRTKQSDAVIMDARADVDYSTLEIVNGRLQYRFECGSGPAVVLVNQKVNDGNWHSVVVERTGSFATLLLDDKHTATGENNRVTDVINLNDNAVYFGAIVKQIPGSRADLIQAGFKGCLKEIKIDKVLLPYTLHNSVATDVTFSGVDYECSEDYYGECSINPCKNEGRCIETGSDIRCNCSGFHGKFCEIDINECELRNPCFTGSTCINTPGSFICSCPSGIIGPLCSQVDECLSNPCANAGSCMFRDKTSGGRGFSCQCQDGYSGHSCEVHSAGVSQGSLTQIHIVIIVAVVIVAVVIVAIVVVVVCKKRRSQQNTKRKRSNSEELFASEMTRSRETHELLHRAPSPAPPSVPPRPASYTPSVNESNLYGRQLNYETSHDYGSAAEGLDRMGSEYMNAVSRSNQPRNLSTFAALPKLTPPPPSISDTDSIKRPMWDFNPPANDNISRDTSIRGLERPGQSKLASRAPTSKTGSRSGSKPTSTANGSFASLPQEDEVSLASVRVKHTNGGRGNKPLAHMAKGYHWDTSDWAPHKDEEISNDLDITTRRIDKDYPKARLLSMSEVDDSEYVGDSEIDDDVIPPLSEVPYGVGEDILAKFKFDNYDLPEINLPKPDKNHYLPTHSQSVIRRYPHEPLASSAKPLIAREEKIPAVPQRSTSLSFSADDMRPEEASALMEGYTSMEGDSQSDTSENICDIESECETELDMESMRAQLKKDRQQTKV